MLSKDPSYPVFTLLVFISFWVTLLPLTWLTYCQRNATILVYIFWLALSCLNHFINSVIWHDSLLNIAPVWCDISSRLYVGASLGIPVSIMCMVHRIYLILTHKWIRVNTRKAMYEDLGLGIGLPILQMIVQCSVAEARFAIYEGLGCFNTTSRQWPAYFVVQSWQTAIAIASSIYGG
ncbi:fungal pheromone STE3G-protein-coupled receptor [Rickenella mellea]|uniref:Fungal pheromone STE3G-protein-coupled receptor n=1 Tax=Rickenella mellea TaxID=50990 RepID=A0A4Y7Q3Q9_9AGAM|nr:fungal pheromone STE3G-protein-coupled receptor [Rickenella mellea]